MRLNLHGIHPVQVFLPRQWLLTASVPIRKNCLICRIKFQSLTRSQSRNDSRGPTDIQVCNRRVICNGSCVQVMNLVVSVIVSKFEAVID